VAWARRAAAAAAAANGSTLRVETAGGAPLPPPLPSPAGQQNGAASSSSASSSMWGVLRCATQELPRSTWQSVERSPLMTMRADEEGEEKGDEDAFGSGRACGARLLPRVLPVFAAPADDGGLPSSASSPPLSQQQHLCVTGGGGGLGLLFARWASVSSASSFPSSSTISLLDCVPVRSLPLELASSASFVVAATRDVATSAGAAASFSSSSCSTPPLPPPSLLLHAAGVLRDSLLPNQTPRNFREVLSGKVHGAKKALSPSSCSSLLTKTPTSVLFSSVSALVAPPGQSNYAAANGALNHLASLGSSAGLPVLAAQWGAWGGGKGLGGMAESNDLLPRVRAAGLGVVGASAGVAALEASLSLSSSSSSSPLEEHHHQLLSPFDWPRLMARTPAVSPAFAEFAPFWHAEQERKKRRKEEEEELLLSSSSAKAKAKASSSAAAAAVAKRPQRKQKQKTSKPQQQKQPRPRRVAAAAAAAAAAAGEEEAAFLPLRSRVEAGVRAAVTRALGSPVPDDAPLMDSGLDSMAAVSLRSGLAGVLSSSSSSSEGGGGGALGEDSLPVTVAFDHPTPAALTDFLVSLLLSNSFSAFDPSSSSPSAVSNQQDDDEEAGEEEEFEEEQESEVEEEEEEEEFEEDESETAVVVENSPSSSFSPSSSSLAARLLPLVLEAARRTLGTDELPSPDAPLMSLGLDSAGALELRAALARVASSAAAGVSSSSSSSSSASNSTSSSSSDSVAAVVVELPATFVFDHPTPAAIASALAELLPQQHTEEEVEVAAAKKTTTKTTTTTKKKPLPLSPQSRPPPSLRQGRPRGPSPAAVAVLSVAARLPSGKIFSSSSFSPADALSATRPLFAGATDLSLPTPAARFDVDEYYAPQGSEEAARTNLSPSHRHAGLTLYARCAALVDALELFDPAAFGLSPAEAAATDPQCRQLLETAGAALLSVPGPSASSSSSAPSLFSSPLVRSRTAVFTGSMF